MIHERVGEETNGEIPKTLKWSLVVINRVGFPVVAFCAMAYICFTTLQKQSDAINNLNITLVKMTASMDSNTEAVRRMGDAMARQNRKND